MDELTTHSTALREFVNDVQRRAEVDSYEEAHQLSHATLGALGEAVSGGQAQQLSGWLPPELAQELAEKSGHAQAFDKPNFLDAVGGAIHTVDDQRVERQVTGVLNALRGSAPAGELDDTIAQLPRELAALFR